MRPHLLIVPLVSLAACSAQPSSPSDGSSPAGAPTAAPVSSQPSFSTTSSSVTMDFEVVDLNECDAIYVQSFSLLGLSSDTWYLNRTGCGTVDHTTGAGNFLSAQIGYDADNNDALMVDLPYPVYSVGFWVRNTGFPWDLDPNIINVVGLDATGIATSGSPVQIPVPLSDWTHYEISADMKTSNSVANRIVRLQLTTRDKVNTVYIDDVTLTTLADTPSAAFAGFFQPVDNGGILNIAKAGSAIPVKFSLGGDFGLGVLLKAPTASAITCPTGAGSDAIEETATSPSGLSYDAGTGQYTYVWKTQSGWKGTCKQLHMPLSDGVDHTAVFQFK
jgi:hypothetical protein